MSRGSCCFFFYSSQLLKFSLHLGIICQLEAFFFPSFTGSNYFERHIQPARPQGPMLTTAQDAVNMSYKWQSLHQCRNFSFSDLCISQIGNNFCFENHICYAIFYKQETNKWNAVLTLVSSTL